MNISVIIPVYNAEPFITEAVHSALGQPEVNEVILVEDGSTDDSLTVCQGLALADSRVRLFQHPGRRNNGAGASRNLGIEKSSFPYIAFLDADDFYLENRFRQTREIFEQFPSADGVYEAAERIFENEDVKATYFDLYKDRPMVSVNKSVSPSHLFQSLVLGNEGWFHLNGLVIKRKILEKTSTFDIRLRQTQDTDFILRLALYGRLYGGDPKIPVAKIRIHDNNRILNAQKVIYYRHLFFKKWFTKTLKNQWDAKVNKHIIKGLLYTHPAIFKYRKFILIRLPIKAIYLLGYLFRYPKIIAKLF